MANEVACIVCDKRFQPTEDGKFKRLPHFEDAVLCNECLLKEAEGASVAGRKERETREGSS